MTASARADFRGKAARLPRSQPLKEQVPLIGGFILLLAVAAGSVWLAVGARRFNQSVEHTLQVRSEAYRLLTLVQDSETGQRGYLLTGNIDYLKPYLTGSMEAPRALEDIERLTRRSEAQTTIVADLRPLIAAKLAELAKTVEVYKGGDPAGALAIVKNNSGNNYMVQIRSGIARMESEEEKVERAQAEQAEWITRLLALASLAGITVVITLAGYTIVTTRRATVKLIETQDQLKNTNENLESIVADRVSELQAANDEIQRFAYIVSHDLRAPLVNVMGFTSELEAARTEIATFLREVEERAPDLATTDRRTAIDTDLPEALGFIRTSTAKMDRLINAILQLSREGRRVLTPQKIDLRALVETQGESLTQQLSVNSATLTVQKDLPDLISDRLAVEQIFGNLIENAVKYLSHDRPGRIAVTGKTHGAYLRYDIVDNGRGIDAKDFERVFELFRRSGEQNTTGEGIGLAYVRNLARRLGGNVSVQSELGTGSTFSVTLPAVFTSKTKAFR